MLKSTQLQKQAIVICAVAAIFYCYEYYLRVAPSVISQELMQYFNISNSGLGILSAFFYYAYMPLQIPVGLLIDKFGTRKVLSTASILCVIGSIMFCSTKVLWIAQIGRLIVGFGSAFAFIGFLKICANWLPHKYYAPMVGLCMLGGMLGAMGGEIILAHMVQYFSWQEAIQLSAWIGLILTIFLWLIIRDEPPQFRSTTLEVNIGSESIFVALEAAVKNRTIWLSGLIGCFTFLPLSSFAEMWAVPYLETIGYSKTDAAFASSMIFLGFGLGGPLWGLCSNWLYSRRRPLIVGSLISAISAWLIILDPYMPSMYMYSALFILGFFSSAEILVFAIGNDIAMRNSSGTVSALINMIVMVGGIILQPLVGKILDVISSSTVSQYQTALLILPISLFMAAALSYIIKETFTE